MSGSGPLTVDPAVGLPSGNPVLGSVTDGVTLPYVLDLGGATSARLVLTFDGQTVADVASGPARGTISVPAGSTGLQRADGVAVRLTALGPGGGTIATAQTVGTVSGAADLGTLLAYNPTEVAVADGGRLFVDQGSTLRFHATAHSSLVNAGIRAYDLTVDGSSILDDPTVGDRPDQWVSGTWTAPTTTGDHAVVYWASVDGDSGRAQQTLTVSVQPAGSFTIDGTDMNYALSLEPGADVPCTGTLMVASSYAPVAGAPVQVLWKDVTGTDWTPVATATTDAQGHFSATWRPTVSGAYQVTTTGLPGTVGGTVSPTVRVDLQAHVRLSVDHASATTGATLTFTVNASTVMSGVDAMLQLWNGMSWTTVGYQSLDPSGTATIRYVPTISGTYRFGALTGYAEQYAPTASDDLSVTVR